MSFRWYFFNLIACFSIIFNPLLSQSIFQKNIIGKGGNDIPTSLIPLPNGNSFMIGNTNSWGFGLTDGFLIKLNTNGDTIFAKNIGDLGDDYFYSIIKTKNTPHFYICGQTNSFGANDIDGLLLKIDTLGNIIWSYRAKSIYINSIHSICELTNGNIAFCGNIQTETGGNDIWVGVIDTSCSVSWLATYGGNYFDYGYKIAPTTDGGVVICGQTQSFRASEPDAYLLKIASDGQLKWTFTIGLEDIGFFTCAIEMANGNILAVGSIKESIDKKSDILLVNLKTDGTLIYAKTLGAKNSETITSLQTTSDSGFILSGSAEGVVRENNNYGMLLKLNKNADFQWATAYGAGIYSQNIYSACELSDGTYLGVGQKPASKPEDNDIWLVKTSSQGITKCSQPDYFPSFNQKDFIIGTGGRMISDSTSIFIPITPQSIYFPIEYKTICANNLNMPTSLDSQKEIKIYPTYLNKTDKLIIDYSTNSNEQFLNENPTKLVEIIDINGKVIFYSTFHKNSQLNISNLSSGMYFCRVLIENRLYSQKIIVE